MIGGDDQRGDDQRGNVERVAARSATGRRLAAWASTLVAADVPARLVPPLVALVFDARTQRDAGPGGAASWSSYAAATVAADENLTTLLDWLDDDSDRLRCRDTWVLSCAVEDDRDNTWPTADEAQRLTTLRETLRGAREQLRNIDVDELRRAVPFDPRWLLHRFRGKLDAHFEPAPTVAFAAVEIARAGGVPPGVRGLAMNGHKIAAVVRALFTGKHGEAGSVGEAASGVRAALRRAGLWPAQHSAAERQAATALAARFARRARLLRERHGDWMAPWPADD